MVVRKKRNVARNGRVRCFGADQRAVSGLGAVGMGGAGLTLTIAILAVSQADLLSQQAQPATESVLDELTLDLRVGTIMGRVDRTAADPVIAELELATSVGLSTDRFDLRTLTMRLANGDRPVIVHHEGVNHTVPDAVFRPQVVRDMDGSMRDQRVGQGDRVDLLVDLAGSGLAMEPGQKMTIFFETDGGTALRLEIEAPRTYGLNDWVQLDGAVLRGA